ncbi:hypothetical protein HQ531_15250 [bacterium]|nr:hypothetical protein [bacterium]
MTRKPPIIVSSGSGVASELAKGLVVKSNPTFDESEAAKDRIVDNVKNLNLLKDTDDGPRLMRLADPKTVAPNIGKPSDAAYYWRLASDDPQSGGEAGEAPGTEDREESQ